MTDDEKVIAEVMEAPRKMSCMECSAVAFTPRQTMMWCTINPRIMDDVFQCYSRGLPSNCPEPFRGSP